MEKPRARKKGPVRIERTRVEIAGSIRDESTKAWKVSDGITTAWLPKSVAKPNFKRGTIEMPGWLAQAKGFM